jgi:hypothetical protein
MDESSTAAIGSVPYRITPIAVLPWCGPKLPSVRITRRRMTVEDTRVEFER